MRCARIPVTPSGAAHASALDSLPGLQWWPEHGNGEECIYFLVRDLAVVYIGRTRSLAKRLDEHEADGKRFDACAFIEPGASARVGEVERMFIEAIGPIDNGNCMADSQVRADKAGKALAKMFGWNIGGADSMVRAPLAGEAQVPRGEVDVCVVPLVGRHRGCVGYLDDNEDECADESHEEGCECPIVAIVYFGEPLVGEPRRFAYDDLRLATEQEARSYFDAHDDLDAAHRYMLGITAPDDDEASDETIAEANRRRRAVIDEIMGRPSE